MFVRDAGVLPTPSHPRSGWPWTVSPAQPHPPADGLPLISIVTPSFNQGRYLEETIRSVLLQGYPNLQYIVLDGGSTDESVSILTRYAPWLSYWASKPDAGQPAAINEGLQMSSGSLFGFINSDDLLLPGALFAIAEMHRLAPDHLIAGDVLEFRETTDQLVQCVDQSGLSFEQLVQIWQQPSWHQPGIFIPRRLFNKIGFFDESLQFAFDYELICRALQHAEVSRIHAPVAMFRLHAASKTCSSELLSIREQLLSSHRFWYALPSIDHAGYRKFAADKLFRAGCSRLRRRQSMGLSLLREGLSTHPWYAVSGAAKEFPRWLWSKLRGR